MRKSWLTVVITAGLVILSGACQRGRAPTHKARGATGSPGGPTQQDAYRQPERLIAALPLYPGARVAEVGAGGGYLTLRLALAVGPTGRVVATDIDEEALAALRKRAVKAGLAQQIETRRVRPADPSLEPGTYDLILLAQVDHLLPDRMAYLRAILPALRPSLGPGSMPGRKPGLPIAAIAVTNGERYRAAALAAARAVPLHVEEVSAGLPGQFLFLLRQP